MSKINKNDSVRFDGYPSVPLRIYIATSFIASAGPIMAKWQGGMDEKDGQRMAQMALAMADALIEEHNKDQK